jgi:hypothetical protein
MILKFEAQENWEAIKFSLSCREVDYQGTACGGLFFKADDFYPGA